jgi:chaperonin GroEL
MYNDVLFGQAARAKMKKGMDVVADAAKVTLGAGGRVVFIDKKATPSYATFDGVTVAGSIELEDPAENAGAKFIREISQKTALDVGDGTTTVCVLLQELVNNGLRYVEANVNPVELKKGMDYALGKVIEYVDSVKKDVGNDTSMLKTIATISANNDREIGNMVGDTFEKIGQYGIIAIEEGYGEETKIEVVSGIKFHCGWASSHFVNSSGNICELNDVLVLLVEAKIEKPEVLLSVLKYCAQEKKSLIVVADEFSSNIVATFLNNANAVPSCCIKWDFSGETKDELMMDLCAMTGATLVSEKKGIALDSITPLHLGNIRKAKIEKKETSFIDCNANEELLGQRKQDAKGKIAHTDNVFLKQKYEQRLAKLNGSIAICKVGGVTEVERKERVDRVDDAVRATKSAIEGGVVPGGGTSLLRASNVDISALTGAEKTGAELVLKSIKKPFLQICENAGVESCELLAGKVLEDENDWTGYNVLDGQIQDLMLGNVLDPANVVKACISNSVSAAGLFLISQCLITDNK